MTKQQKDKTLAELERLKAMLDQAGIEYETSAPSFVMFDNANGQCMAFPSQTYDDKLVALYPAKIWCDTAEDVLAACGVGNG